MKNQRAIVGEHITKRYQLYKSQSDRLAAFLFGKKGTPFYALRDISFSVNEGDSLGLVGMNGSGKSTLSNIIAGLTMPSSGVITTNGTSSLIAVSSGLNNFLTGTENIEMKGLMLGFTMDQINEMKAGIAEFADIGEFIDQPVKSYSSGMRSRLGFAISASIDPDIMIIDEALSVGDSAFAQKCLEKMNSFRARGKTIVFVSHSTKQVQTFCDKVMWLECGVTRAFGAADEIIPAYEAFISQFCAWSKEEQRAYQNRIRKSTAIDEKPDPFEEDDEY